MRFGLSKLPHLELRVSNLDVASKPEAIWDLSKFEYGHSGSKLRMCNSGKFPPET